MRATAALPAEVPPTFAADGISSTLDALRNYGCCCLQNPVASEYASRIFSEAETLLQDVPGGPCCVLHGGTSRRALGFHPADLERCDGSGPPAKHLLSSWWNAVLPDVRHVAHALCCECGMELNNLVFKSADMCVGRLLMDNSLPPSCHSSHTDAPAFTLLWYPQGQGLDVKRPRGDWFHAMTAPGAALLLTGDLLHFQSAGMVAPTTHRSPCAPAPRSALMLFAYPDKNVSLGPSPVPPYEHLTVEEYSAWHTASWKASAAWIVEVDKAVCCVGASKRCQTTIWQHIATQRFHGAAIPCAGTAAAELCHFDGRQPTSQGLWLPLEHECDCEECGEKGTCTTDGWGDSRRDCSFCQDDVNKARHWKWMLSQILTAGFSKKQAYEAFGKNPGNAFKWLNGVVAEFCVLAEFSSKEQAKQIFQWWHVEAALEALKKILEAGFTAKEAEEAMGRHNRLTDALDWLQARHEAIREISEAGFTDTEAEEALSRTSHPDDALNWLKARHQFPKAGLTETKFEEVCAEFPRRSLEWLVGRQQFLGAGLPEGKFEEVCKQFKGDKIDQALKWLEGRKKFLESGFTETKLEQVCAKFSWSEPQEWLMAYWTFLEAGLTETKFEEVCKPLGKGMIHKALEWLVARTELLEAFREDNYTEKEIEAVLEWYPSTTRASEWLKREEQRVAKESRLLGIQLKWVLECFPTDVQKYTQCKAQDMNFIDMAPIVAYGEMSYGKNKICPRDRRMHCSIVDGLYKEGTSARATIFLSWVWKYSLGLVMDALCEFQDFRLRDAGLTSANCFIWWCFFNNNQHRILGDGAQITTEALANIFGNQLKAVGRMVCMMDRIESSQYTTRIWCNFEVFVADKDRISMEVILPSSRRQEINSMFMQGGLERLRQGMRVDCEKAEASRKDDERNIKDLIQARSSFNAVDEAVHKSLVQCVGTQITKALSARAELQAQDFCTNDEQHSEIKTLFGEVERQRIEHAELYAEYQEQAERFRAEHEVEIAEWRCECQEQAERFRVEHEVEIAEWRGEYQEQTERFRAEHEGALAECAEYQQQVEKNHAVTNNEIAFSKLHTAKVPSRSEEEEVCAAAHSSTVEERRRVCLEDDEGKARIIATFRKFDLEGHGTISRANLQQVVQTLIPSISVCDLDILIKFDDTNRTGLIDYVQFVNSLWRNCAIFSVMP